MADTLKTPFQCGGQIVTFPSKQISGTLVLRIDDATPTDKVLLKLGKHSGVVAADNADIYLNAGESYEVPGGCVPDGSQIQILNISGDPLIYWFLSNI